MSNREGNIRLIVDFLGSKGHSKFARTAYQLFRILVPNRHPQIQYAMIAMIVSVLWCILLIFLSSSLTQ